MEGASQFSPAASQGLESQTIVRGYFEQPDCERLREWISSWDQVQAFPFLNR